MEHICAIKCFGKCDGKPELRYEDVVRSEARRRKHCKMTRCGVKSNKLQTEVMVFLRKYGGFSVLFILLNRGSVSERRKNQTARSGQHTVVIYTPYARCAMNCILKTSSPEVGWSRATASCCVNEFMCFLRLMLAALKVTLHPSLRNFGRLVSSLAYTADLWFTKAALPSLAVSSVWRHVKPRVFPDR